jgi:hypothetical protein
MPQTIPYGPFKVTYGVGVVLEHVPSRCEVYFQPGDDSNTFLERFQDMQDAAPNRPIALILATLWEDYRP